jgi:Tfp pilus assembly major pilin PilA
MREQSGRSLIEMLGVLAIAGVMTAGTIKMYQVVRTRQVHMIAAEDIKTIALNTKVLYATHSNYNEISVDYLIKAGVMNGNKSPLPGSEFSVTSNPGSKEFAMVFSNLDFKECAWLTTLKTDWASKVSVNGYFEHAVASCKKNEKNEVAIWVK